VKLGVALVVPFFVDIVDRSAAARRRERFTALEVVKEAGYEGQQIQENPDR
jgi:hypothetical protein